MKPASLFMMQLGLVILVILSSVGQSEGGGGLEKGKMEGVLKTVAGKKIFFGHQSVGQNILEGIDDLARKHPGAGLKVVKTDDPGSFKGPIFAHALVGENDDPRSKIDDFTRTMDRGIGNEADIAFFKFCYIDVNKTSDVDKIFSSYQEGMARLKARYPRTRFVHVTVPLTVHDDSLKSKIKKLLGREDNNIKRDLFNKKLIREYDGKEPVFDLARIESTFRDGKRVIFTEKGERYFSLAPEYSDDGGHLNPTGRITVAEELLEFLAALETRK